MCTVYVFLHTQHTQHTEVVCPEISVSGGRVRQTGKRLGDVAQVSCIDSCHVLRGTAGKMRCMESGEWDSVIPYCQRQYHY